MKHQLAPCGRATSAAKLLMVCTYLPAALLSRFAAAGRGDYTFAMITPWRRRW